LTFKTAPKKKVQGTHVVYLKSAGQGQKAEEKKKHRQTFMRSEQSNVQGACDCQRPSWKGEVAAS